MADSLAKNIAAACIRSSATIRDAMEAIDASRLGAAFVVDQDNCFITLLTDGDIRRALLRGEGMMTKAVKVASSDPTFATQDMLPGEVVQLLNTRIRIVPVLDAEGRVVDIARLDVDARLPVAEPTLGERELRYVSECVLTGWVSSSGSFISRFEAMFAECCGTKNAVATSSGTAALHLALLSLGVGPGDEVIVPTLTFIATANAVLYTGATPIFVDSESRTWNMDPAEVAGAITPDTKAIIPVHLYGHPARMDELMAIARHHDIPVVEDAAEAHGALFQGHAVGSIGELGTFSFFGNKILTTGEGGMITTDDYSLARSIRMLRDHGMSRGQRYWHPVLGYNYRMTNLQAALGVAQMEQFEEILAAKDHLRALYDQLLSKVPGVELSPRNQDVRSVCWLYSALVNEEVAAMDRDTLMTRLAAKGIETRPFFIPVHTQPIYNRELDLPVAQTLARRGISLPSSVRLSDREIEKVGRSVAAVLDQSTVE